MIVHILSLNDDDDDAKALPTGVPKDDAMKKGGWGGQNVSKSDGVILVCSLTCINMDNCISKKFRNQMKQETREGFAQNPGPMRKEKLTNKQLTPM